MGAARHCDNLFRPSRLGDRPDLRTGAAASLSVRRSGRQRADDRRRHHRRQGRLPESRPDGLRQHLRHGVVFRRGLYRLDPRPARGADQAKPSQLCRNSAGHHGARQQVARHYGSRRNAARADHARRRIARRSARRCGRRPRRCRSSCRAIDLTQPRVVVPDAVAPGHSRRRRPSSRPSSTPSTCPPAGFRPKASTRCCASRPPISSSIRRSPRSRGGPIIRTPHGPRTGRTSHRSATRRRPTPSNGRGSASASPSSRWGSCCGSIAPISTTPMTRRWRRGLATYRALTPSQVKTGKYFIVVALVFLASQGAGAIMAHSYYDRATFYGVQLNYILPFNFLQELPLAGADHLDRPGLDRERPVHCSGDCRRPRGEGPGIPGRPVVLGLAVRRRRGSASAITSASRA